MKEFYIAPEVLIMCFAPTEELANNDWAQYAVSGGDPDLPDSEGSNVDVDLGNDPNDGE